MARKKRPLPVKREPLVPVKSFAFVDDLESRTNERAYVVRRDEIIPEEVRPWLIVTRMLTESGPHNSAHKVRVLLAIPTWRVEDWIGDDIDIRTACRSAEGIWTLQRERVRGLPPTLIGLMRLVRSPAPKSWTWELNGSNTKFCASHCSYCGLHFSSDTAFFQHVREGHRHPSKSEKLIPITDQNTACALMGVMYDHPLCKHLPAKDQSTRYVPGVRIWEHIDAERARSYFARRV